MEGMLHQTGEGRDYMPSNHSDNTHLGYGIDIDQRYEETIIGHSGGWYGIRCEWMDFRDSNYTVIILSNFDNDGQQDVSDFFKSKISRKLEVK